MFDTNGNKGNNIFSQIVAIWAHSDNFQPSVIPTHFGSLKSQTLGSINGYPWCMSVDKTTEWVAK